eukprot:9496144-Pyramimonas_sp.AAC.1
MFGPCSLHHAGHTPHPQFVVAPRLDRLGGHGAFEVISVFVGRRRAVLRPSYARWAPWAVVLDCV